MDHQERVTGQNKACLITHCRHLQRWCLGFFLPAPVSLSSGYSSQLLPGSACRPVEEAEPRFTHRGAGPKPDHWISWGVESGWCGSRQGMHLRNMSTANRQNEIHFIFFETWWCFSVGNCIWCLIRCRKQRPQGVWAVSRDRLGQTLEFVWYFFLCPKLSLVKF